MRGGVAYPALVPAGFEPARPIISTRDAQGAAFYLRIAKGARSGIACRRPVGVFCRTVGLNIDHQKALLALIDIKPS